MSQALYRKWRPRQWEQVIGQEHIVNTLKNAIRSNRVGHAYLFSGPRGTGKTTTARLLAKAVNCLDGDFTQRPCDRCTHCLAVNESRFLDLIEIDAASNTSVDDIRDLRDKINFSPSQGKYKVYIIDEVHMLSTAAFNALLKTLEEPPAHAIFILATTEVHKIPATVLSRCQRYEFRRIPVNEIVAQLQMLALEEKIDVEPDALTLIARQSTGSMRDAISLFDQLASAGETITLATTQTILGTATNQMVVALVSAILAKSPAAGLESIHKALDSGTDARQFARQIVEYLRSLLLVRLGNSNQVDATIEQRTLMAQQAAAFDTERLLEVIRLFTAASSDSRSGWHPGLLLELSLAEACEPEKRLPAVEAVQKAVQEQVFPKASQPEPPGKTTPVIEEKHVSPQVNPIPNTIETKNEGTPGATPTLEEIRQNWRRIRDVLKQKSKPAEALLNSSKPVQIKEGVLILGFSTEVLKSKMETRENLDLTSQAISQVTGKSVTVTCTVVGSQAKSMPAGLEIDEDGLVGTALNLGGKIVDKG